MNPLKYFNKNVKKCLIKINYLDFIYNNPLNLMRIPKLKLFLAIFSFILIVTNLQAQDSTMHFKAFVDIYYAYDWNEPIGGQRQYNNQVGRHNEFNLNHGFFMATYNDGKIRGEFGLQAGAYPDINNAHEPSDLYKAIYRANVGLKLHEKIWVDAGIFEGHFGYEVVETMLNENYSKAMCSEYTPYYQAGVRGIVEFSEKVTLTLVVLNGWQNMVETNDTKAFGMDIDIFPNENLEINYGNYFGDEGNSFIGSKYRQHHEGYFKYRFSPKFHSVLTYDLGRQELMTSDDVKTIISSPGSQNTNSLINGASLQDWNM